MEIIEKIENKKKFAEPDIEILKIDSSDLITTSGWCESDCDPDSCTSDGTCFTGDTKITMADGEKKNAEDVKVGDAVMTFNHESGELEPKEIYLAFKGNELRKLVVLTFEDGNELSLVAWHDLFEKESKKYVRITVDNAEEFIGKHFYNADTKSFVKLVGVTHDETTVDYCLYSKDNQNCITNGLLNVAADVDYILNVFEFGDDLKADMNAYAEDVKKYGLFEYSDNLPISKEEFDFLKAERLNIAIGKGLVTKDEALAANEDYLKNK